MRRLLLTRALALCLVLPVSAVAELDPIYLQLGTYLHFDPSSDHEGPPLLTGAELELDDRHFAGLALFNNSFGQFSQFAYYGWRYSLDWPARGVRLKLPVGLVHGYRGEHQSDIPLNQLGIAPAILPSIGYQRGDWGADVVLLGTAGVLFSVGYRFGD